MQSKDLLQRPHDNTVVLAYHRISQWPLMAGTWVSPRQLAGHLDHLLARGCRPLTGADWIHRQQQLATPGNEAQPPEFLITFDDGTEDLFVQRDILARRNVTGVVFVPASLLGRRNDWEWPLPGRRTRHLDLPQLAVLHREGWEIGLHGATHQDLTRLSTAVLREELVTARSRLADQIGAPVRLLSYPFGRVDTRVASVADEAGFKAGFVLTGVPAGLPQHLVVRRRPVYCIDSAADVAVKVFDPLGKTHHGRREIGKEGFAHGVGRWFGGRKYQTSDSTVERSQP